MTSGYKQHRPVASEDRREFLRALDLDDVLEADDATLDDVRSEVSAGTAEELASFGRAIESELSGSIDASLIARQQVAMAMAVGELASAFERGLPAASEGPRTEFAPVAEACQPVYDHLDEVGFFESTAKHVPEFDPETVTATVESFVGSEPLLALLSTFNFGEESGVDLLATLFGNIEQLVTDHWPDTEIPRESISYGEQIPVITKSTAGGVLLWLNDLDLHLWQKEILITEEIHAHAIWHGKAMAAGFYLMSEAAKLVGEESDALSDEELGTLLATGFAVQALSKGLLPQDVYWITETMRKPRRAI